MRNSQQILTKSTKLLMDTYGNAFSAAKGCPVPYPKNEENLTFVINFGWGTPYKGRKLLQELI